MLFELCTDQNTTKNLNFCSAWEMVYMVAQIQAWQIEYINKDTWIQQLF